MNKAIVLLGYSGVGKDTTFNVLSELDDMYVNVKFSLLWKQIVASMFGVKPSKLEDKELRTSITLTVGSIDTSITAYDMLNCLFRGLSDNDTTGGAHIRYISKLLKLMPGVVPVFTDIRRHQELSFVTSNFKALIVNLRRTEITQGVSDGYIDDIVASQPFFITRVNQSAESTAELIHEIITEN